MGETEMMNQCCLSTLVQPVIDEFARIGIKGKLHISKVFNGEYDTRLLPADLNELLEMNIEGISIRSADITSELAQFCLQNNIQINIFFTLKFKEDKKYYSKLVELGVRKFITDHPNQVMEFRSSFS